MEIWKEWKEDPGSWERLPPCPKFRQAALSPSLHSATSLPDLHSPILAKTLLSQFSQNSHPQNLITLNICSNPSSPITLGDISAPYLPSTRILSSRFNQNPPLLILRFPLRDLLSTNIHAPPWLRITTCPHLISNWDQFYTEDWLSLLQSLLNKICCYRFKCCPALVFFNSSEERSGLEL